MATDFKKIFRYPYSTFITHMIIIWTLFVGLILCIDYYDTTKILILVVGVILCVLATIMLIVTLSRYLHHVKELKNLIIDIINKEGYYNIKTKASDYTIKELHANILALYIERVKVINNAEARHNEEIEMEKSKLRSKRIVTNNINHEIKTPIGILQGYIETLMRHPDIAPQLREKFLSKCFDNIRRIDNIMSSISILTRLDDGSEAIKLDDILLYNVVKNIHEEMNLFLAKENIKFNINIPRDTTILTNESFFYALLNNLTKNAINYARCTEITFSLVGEDDNFYTFEFYDNGVGVEEDYLQHLFDRFYRIDNNYTKVAGSGLGLPIVQSIVHFHGGTIKPQNHPNGGLSFIFTISKK